MFLLMARSVGTVFKTCGREALGSKEDFIPSECHKNGGYQVEVNSLIVFFI